MGKDPYMILFMDSISKVWREVFPEFELKLSRFIGVLDSQIQLVSMMQQRLLTAVAGGVWIAGCWMVAQSMNHFEVEERLHNLTNHISVLQNLTDHVVFS